MKNVESRTTLNILSHKQTANFRPHLPQTTSKMGKYLTAPVSLKAGSRHNAAVRASRSRVRSRKAFLRGARRCSVSVPPSFLLPSFLPLSLLGLPLTMQSLSSAKTLAIGREEIRPTTRSVLPSFAELDDSDSEYEFDGSSESDLSEFSDGDFESNWE